MKFQSAIILAVLISLSILSASVIEAKPCFQNLNAKEAQTLNDKFSKLKASSDCEDGENACIGGKFAKCDHGKFVLTPCPKTTECTALPLVNKRGTSVTCDTPKDARNRINLALKCRGKTG